MRSTDVEQHLDDRTVKYTYRDSINLSAIDEKSSLQNQARFEPIHEEAVLRYAEAMERGDKFPAVVAYKTASGKYVLIDGNHRFQASKRNGYKDIDLYEVDATDEILQVLTFEANARHGIPPSTEERVRHAIYLIDNGATIEAAAGMVGLITSAVQNAWTLERSNRRARQLGMTRGWNRLTRDQKVRLAGVLTDAGFKAATQFVVDAKLSTAETKRLTQDLKPLRSDSAQVKHVEEVKEQYREASASNESGRRIHQRLDARRSLIPHLGYITGCDADAVVNATITPQQIDDLLVRVREAEDVLGLLRETLTDKKATNGNGK